MGPNVTGLGESVLAADGRPNGLAMFIRVGSPSPLATHALTQSSDGGETWAPAKLLPDIVGTTCQGAVGHDPTAIPGSLLLSAPSWPSGGLSGRRNVSLWSFNDANPEAKPLSLMTVWPLGGGYSSFDTTGGKIRILYEGGPPHVYDYSILISHIDKVPNAK